MLYTRYAWVPVVFNYPTESQGSLRWWCDILCKLHLAISSCPMGTGNAALDHTSAPIEELRPLLPPLISLSIQPSLWTTERCLTGWAGLARRCQGVDTRVRHKITSALWVWGQPNDLSVISNHYEEFSRNIPPLCCLLKAFAFLSVNIYSNPRWLLSFKY